MTGGANTSTRKRCANRSRVAGRRIRPSWRVRWSSIVLQPQVSIANKLALALTRLEQEFGLTPSARARIDVKVEPKEPGPLSIREFAKLKHGPPAEEICNEQPRLKAT